MGNWAGWLHELSWAGRTECEFREKFGRKCRSNASKRSLSLYIYIHFPPLSISFSLFSISATPHIQHLYEMVVGMVSSGHLRWQACCCMSASCNLPGLSSPSLSLIMPPPPSCSCDNLQGDPEVASELGPLLFHQECQERFFKWLPRRRDLFSLLPDGRPGAPSPRFRPKNVPLYSVPLQIPLPSLDTCIRLTAPQSSADALIRQRNQPYKEARQLGPPGKVFPEEARPYPPRDHR